MPAQPASDPPEFQDLASGGRRLRPSAVPIWFLYDAGRAILGLIPLLVVGGLSPVLIFVALFMLVSPAIRYSRFRYDVLGNTLVVEGGVINRWRRVIPRDRVQSIDVVQKLRHRAFGVVELRIEAVGGKQTEAALVALLPQEADRIRSWASSGREQPEEKPDPAEEMPALARLSRKDLLVAGITGGRVAVLAALLGYAQELVGEDTFDRLASVGTRLLPGASVAVLVSVLVIGILATSLILSIVLTVVIYWDFTVLLEERRLVITRGLLERRRAQIPLRRVQAVQVHENFLRRALGLASLSIVVAGYSSEGQENQESSVLLPLGRTQTAWNVASQVLGAPDLESVPLTQPPRRSVIRKAIVPTAAGFAAGWAATLAAGPPGALALLIVPLSWLGGWLVWRSTGHGDIPGFVLVRSGVLVRRTAIVPEANIQHLQLTWSMLQKAFGLATVKVHIPGSLRRASDLDRATARSWFRRLSEGA